MNLAICSLASGSSGNCYLVRSEKAAVLVDAGISAKQIRTKLGLLGLSPAGLSGVLITHGHSDHIKGLRVLDKELSAKIYATGATLSEAQIEDPEGKTETFGAGDAFDIEDIRVSSFPVSHDAADPVGFSFESGGRKISIVTDTGTVTPLIKKAVRSSDILVMESNHDESMLRMGRYPWFLKQRIAGDLGHLSNEAAAEAVAEMLSENKSGGKNKICTILLAHLSRENNFPEMARITVSGILESKGFLINKDFTVETLPRTEASRVYSL